MERSKILRQDVKETETQGIIFTGVRDSVRHLPQRLFFLLLLGILLQISDVFKVCTRMLRCSVQNKSLEKSATKSPMLTRILREKGRQREGRMTLREGEGERERDGEGGLMNTRR